VTDGVFNPIRVLQNAAIIGAAFTAFLVAGTLLFVRSERNR